MYQTVNVDGTLDQLGGNALYRVLSTSVLGASIDGICVQQIVTTSARLTLCKVNDAMQGADVLRGPKKIVHLRTRYLSCRLKSRPGDMAPTQRDGGLESEAGAGGRFWMRITCMALADEESFSRPALTSASSVESTGDTRKRGRRVHLVHFTPVEAF
ncbi:hypothetical protein BHE74_00028070 [Ensete ventricosum]|nr:hypothetical protein BHE74_00028070 [Ensete ventricosum]